MTRRSRRWLGYLGCWAGVLFVPGILLVFFKDGIFAYQGVIAYLIPLVAFGAWVLALSWGGRRAALAQPTRASDGSSETDERAEGFSATR